MADITLPPLTNEFSVASALVILISYCVYPADASKRDAMVKLFNIWLCHLFEAPILEEISDNWHCPDNFDGFWRGLREFGALYKFEVPEDLPSKTTPYEYAEAFVKQLAKLASNSVELPDDIKGFLISARPPVAMIEDVKGALPGIQTAVLIVLKLVSLQKHASQLRCDPSLSLAIQLLKLKKNRPIRNITDIKNTWKVHKKSVHIVIGLFAAYLTFKSENNLLLAVKEINSQKGYYKDFLSPACIGVIILISRLIQDFLVSFKTSRHSTTPKLIELGQIWQMPNVSNHMGADPYNWLFADFSG